MGGFHLVQKLYSFLDLPGVWSRDPHCAHCGKLCEFPEGFELDHKVPLFQGGEDTDENCQVLCFGPDGCHAKKTAQDMRR